MSTIYHITSREAWKQVKDNSTFEPSSLSSEGFVHCSTKEQLLVVLNRFFKNAEEVLILEIDTGKLSSKLIFEISDGESFPHIYGAINISSVRKTHLLDFKEKGKFKINF